MGNEMSDYVVTGGIGDSVSIPISDTGLYSGVVSGVTSAWTTVGSVTSKEESKIKELEDTLNDFVNEVAKLTIENRAMKEDIRLMKDIICGLKIKVEDIEERELERNCEFSSGDLTELLRGRDGI